MQHCACWIYRDFSQRALKVLVGRRTPRVPWDPGWSTSVNAWTLKGDTVTHGLVFQNAFLEPRPIKVCVRCVCAGLQSRLWT